MHKIISNFNSKICIKNIIDENIFDYLNTTSYDYVFIITQEQIFNLYNDHEIFQRGYKVIKIQHNQPIKNLEMTHLIINDLTKGGCTRNSLIIGFGGGVITDFSGFIASIYMRGIKHILIPTTLLGMVDAAIGGKTGINTKFGKNLIGTFKYPEYIYIDSFFLKTLKQEYMIDGFAEIIKYGLIKDKNLFFQSIDNFHKCINQEEYAILNNIIKTCCDYKVQIVEQDQCEQNQRMILNFGHTIGHALETYYNYEYLSHGQAVYYGINAASFISWKLNHISGKNFKKINDFIKTLSLLDISGVEISAVISNLNYDKKQKGNKNQFILLNDLGSCFITNKVPSSIIEESLKFIIN
tara:strand:- start:17 stop:1075 length:1059 start_codon:yes stop_codon:yes gene_type:complete